MAQSAKNSSDTAGMVRRVILKGVPFLLMNDKADPYVISATPIPLKSEPELGQSSSAAPGIAKCSTHDAYRIWMYTPSACLQQGLLVRETTLVLGELPVHRRSDRHLAKCLGPYSEMPDSNRQM